MKGLAISLLILSGILLLGAILGSLFSTRVTRYALKRRRIQIWRMSCLTATFYEFSFLSSILALVLGIQLKTRWFSDEMGTILGVGVGLALLSSALWESIQKAPDVYRRRQKRSLDSALPQGLDRKRMEFNRTKSVFESDDPEGRKNLFNYLFRYCECELEEIVHDAQS